jgi:hypothetical protein
MAAPIDHSARFASVPPPGAFAASQVVRELGDGLVLRRASPADADALDAFTRVVQADPPDFLPVDGLGVWARDLVCGSHPVVAPGDFWIVEDTARKRIASSLGLISHRMRYDGIGFDAGQVELVGSHPDYRHRGLVRLQLEELHRVSAERGQRLQWIAGIPYYYRQFGYEMALETDAAGVVPRAQLPDKPPDAALRWRAAEPADAAHIAELAAHGAGRSRVACEVDAAFWRYEIETKRKDNLSRRDIHVLEDARGRLVALLMAAPTIHRGTLLVRAVEIAPQTAWPDVSAAVLARARAIGDGRAAAGGAAFESVRFELGSDHPLYRAERARIRDRRRAYALFVRIEHLAGFLELVAPALEQRLARSEQAGRSGELELSFYRDGLRLRFEAGRLRGVERWQPSTEQLGHLAFPGLSFLQLLLGFRSLGELQHAFPDCYAWSEAHAPWVEALFPPAPSSLLPVS